MNLQLIDTHAHLGMLEHAPGDEIIKRADESGIWKMVTVSTNPESWEKNRLIADKNERIFYSVGLHPHEAKEWPAVKSEMLSKFVKKNPPSKCVAIGEMGLDFHYNLSPREAQLIAFREQLALAENVSLPVIIHCRDAFEDLFKIIQESPKNTRTGVMHCFTGTLAEARRSVDLGYYISFSGILTFKNSESLRDVARAIPMERILIETDCPFLAPVPMRGKPNEPSYLIHTATLLATLKNLSLEEVAKQTTQNAIKLFRI